MHGYATSRLRSVLRLSRDCPFAVLYASRRARPVVARCSRGECRPNLVPRGIYAFRGDARLLTVDVQRRDIAFRPDASYPYTGEIWLSVPSRQPG